MNQIQVLIDKYQRRIEANIDAFDRQIYEEKIC